MNFLKLLSISLLAGMFSVNSAQAQLLNKLKKRVQEATEDVIIDKTAEKAAQEAGKTLDSLLEIDPDYLSKQAQLQMITPYSKDLPIEANYEFNTNVVYEMENVSKDESTVIDYGMWFSKDENYMATEIKSIESKEKGQQDMPSNMFTVLDEKNKTMVVFMEDQKMAQLVSMESIKDIAIEENENINTDLKELKKSGQTKKILGYTCEEYVLEDADNKFSIWTTDELELTRKNMFFNLGESLGGNTFKNIPKGASGLMMEMHYEDVLNGESGKMVAKEINKQFKSINSSEYQYMDLSQLMKN